MLGLFVKYIRHSPHALTAQCCTLCSCFHHLTSSVWGSDTAASVWGIVTFYSEVFGWQHHSGVPAYQHWPHPCAGNHLHSHHQRLVLINQIIINHPLIISQKLVYAKHTSFLWTQYMNFSPPKLCLPISRFLYYISGSKIPDVCCKNDLSSMEW